MKRSGITLTAMFAVFLFAAQAAVAATHRVPLDYPTIQAAVDAAQTGDKVVIMPGLYTEVVTIASKSGITLEGKPGSVLSAEGIALAGVHVSGSFNIKIKGVALLGGTGIIVADSDVVKIMKCEVIGSLEGIVLIRSDACLVKRNRIDGVEGSGIVVGHYDSPDTKCDDNLIIRNEVTSCLRFGITVYGDRNDITRNTLEGNTWAGIDVRSDELHDDPFNSVRRNEIHSGEGTGIQLSGSGHYVALNYIFDTEGVGIFVRAHNCRFIRNRIVNTGQSGIVVSESFASLFKKNRVFGALGSGVVLNSGAIGATWLKNVATNNANCDLVMYPEPEDNEFVKNDFKHVNCLKD